MRVIFHTPSRRCPSRIYNGREVWGFTVIGRKWVRRLGKHSQVYLCQVDRIGAATNDLIRAYEDELFIDPIVGRDVGDGSPVYASEVEAGLAEEVDIPFYDPRSDVPLQQAFDRKTA